MRIVITTLGICSCFSSSRVVLTGQYIKNLLVNKFYSSFFFKKTSKSIWYWRNCWPRCQWTKTCQLKFVKWRETLIKTSGIGRIYCKRLDNLDIRNLPKQQSIYLLHMTLFSWIVNVSTTVSSTLIKLIFSRPIQHISISFSRLFFLILHQSNHNVAQRSIKKY